VKISGLSHLLFLSLYYSLSICPIRHSTPTYLIVHTIPTISAPPILCQIKDLRAARQAFVELEAQHGERKRAYEHSALGLDSERARLEQEVQALTAGTLQVRARGVETGSQVSLSRFPHASSKSDCPHACPPHSGSRKNVDSFWLVSLFSNLIHPICFANRPTDRPPPLPPLPPQEESRFHYLHAHAALKQAALDKVAAEAQFLQGGATAAGARRLSAEHRSHTERAERHLAAQETRLKQLRQTQARAVQNP
jgi:hypothetical protein